MPLVGPAVAHTVTLSSPVCLLFAGATCPGPLVPTRHFRVFALDSSLPLVHTARLSGSSSQSLQCDLGSNINVTADETLLHHYAPLSVPFDLQGADASVARMSCVGRGMFRLSFLDNTSADVQMYLCPQISETLLSPQAICDDAPTLFSGFTIHCSALDNSFVRFHRPACPVDLPGCAAMYSDAPLLRSNNLFYFAQLHPRSVPTTASAMRLSQVLTTELWHQRLGHSGMHQLQHLQQCSTGLPSGLHRSIHPFHSCKICDDARSRKPPMGPATAISELLPGSRFHLDFGFMRASSDTFLKSPQATRVVLSHDGFSSYLLIADAYSRFTWVFLTASKDAPVSIVTKFLSIHGRKSGYRGIRVDQGGELCASHDLRQVFYNAEYTLEPTGNDTPNQNGKAERLNGTFGTMVRSLLYSAGLGPKYWSSALVHAVHLKNRLWHSAIHTTPYHLWTGKQPDLSHLRIFGSLISPRRNGARPAKLDKHTYDGIFLGYTSTCSNITYVDIHTGRVKICQAPTHFDESHFSNSRRPPGPQFLFDLGLHSTTPSSRFSVPTTTVPCPKDSQLLYPPLLLDCPPCPLPSLACITPLPISELLDTSSISLFSAAAVAAPEVMSIAFSDDPFGPSFLETIPITGSHPSAGIETRFDASRGRLQITHLLPGNAVSRIPRWRTRIKHAYILALNGVDIPDLPSFVKQLSTLRNASSSEPTAVLKLTFDEAINTLSASGLPLLYFDQLRHIHGINRDLRLSKRLLAYAAVSQRLTRRGLQSQPGWVDWLRSEAEQLDNYLNQGMFGEPCLPPSNAAIFHWVWIYKIKQEENNRKKARAVCDGSTRGGQARVAGHTFAPTPDMTDLRLFFALAALENKLVFGADVSNAFAEADAPAQEYFMRVDAQFREWWISKGNRDIPPGFVIPILKNLQGHPEAPRQWSRHIDAILKQHGFTPTVHAPCLYRAVYRDENVLFLRQVDDFAIATNQEALYTSICNALDSHLLVPMKRQGLLTHYNGIDIIQSRDYITIHVGSYIRRIIASHGWTDMHKVALPMSSDNEHIRALDSASPPLSEADCLLLEKLFRYRGCVGELIWAMITTRPEVSFPVTKLSQYSTAPAALHYQAVKRVFRYLNSTADDGLTYWRPTAHALLPAFPLPPRLAANVDHPLTHDVSDAVEKYSPSAVLGYVDSDWAADIRHRRSISGIVFKLAGAAIAWKCRVQPTVSLSSTEAEFLAASDAGKMALYLRSILDELGVAQQYATVIYEDNRGALLMANAAQPTKQSRHIDIREYALLDWVERDLITLEDVSSGLNASDILTKQTGPILFARHVDNLSGRVPPPYVVGHPAPAPADLGHPAPAPADPGHPAAPAQGALFPSVSSDVPAGRPMPAPASTSCLSHSHSAPVSLAPGVSSEGGCSSPGSVPVPSGRLTPETVCLPPWSSSVTHF